MAIRAALAIAQRNDEAARMQGTQSTAAALAGCYVISLRPVGAHAAMRRAAAAHGARLLALSPWKLVPRDDDATRATLRDALAAKRVIATSPAAVRAANALSALSQVRDATWLAVGAGTATALKRVGVTDVVHPARMDSEGLLGLPALQDVHGMDIGVLTAPGGRERIESVLQTRDARVVRADVYERVAAMPSANAFVTLLGLQAPLWLAVSSGDALQRALDSFPPAAVARMHGARVVVASERLAAVARAHGLEPVFVAADARPRSLIDAAAVASRGIR
ncbi:MAG: uroporphyrinogen-III synthase [Luteimonas sp.]